MSSAFVYIPEIYETTYIKHICITGGNNISSILLLANARASIEEYVYTPNNVIIQRVMSIEEGVRLAETVVVLFQNLLPKESVEFIEDLCKRMQKKYINWEIDVNYLSFPLQSSFETLLSDFPTFVICECGESLDTCNVYLSIAAALEEMGNHVIEASQIGKKDDSHLENVVLLCTIPHKMLVGRLLDFLNCITKLKPDYLVFLNSNDEIFHKARGYIDGLLNIKPDMVVISEYKRLNNEAWVSNKCEKDTLSDYSLSAEENMVSILKEDITLKLCFPDGIKRLSRQILDSNNI